jgi:hypothetical protein
MQIPLKVNCFPVNIKFCHLYKCTKGRWRKIIEWINGAYIPTYTYTYIYISALKVFGIQVSSQS